MVVTMNSREGGGSFSSHLTAGNPNLHSEATSIGKHKATFNTLTETIEKNLSNTKN